MVFFVVVVVGWRLGNSPCDDPERGRTYVPAKSVEAGWFGSLADDTPFYYWA